jgi:hypothetical protein
MSERRSATENEMELDGSRIRQRLRALRTRYPGLALTTALTQIHDDQVVMRAAITLPDGTSVSAHAAEPSDASGLIDSAIELAEQRATTRALDLLGIGEVPATTGRTDTVPEVVREEAATPPLVEALRKSNQRSADAPVAPEPAPQREPERRAAAPREPAPAPPARESGAPRQQSAPPVREPVAPRNQPVPPARAEPEPDMADYSWTDFWKWARANNLNAKGQVEQRIGRSIEGLQPHEVRTLLFESGVPRS